MTPAVGDNNLKPGQQNQLRRAAKLRRLLTANSDEEKIVIKTITSCIKFMHQNYDIEAFRMHRLLQTILKELGCSIRQSLLPQYMNEELFVLMASAILKVPQLQNTRLYDKLKECLTETGTSLEIKKEQQPNPNQSKILASKAKTAPKMGCDLPKKWLLDKP